MLVNNSGPIDPRVKEVRVVDVIEDPASGGNKVAVVLELALPDGAGRNVFGLEQLFQTDEVKRLAIPNLSLLKKLSPARISSSK